MSHQTKRKAIGEKLCHWHSSMGDPIYAVGSFYLSDKEYPDPTIVKSARDSLKNSRERPHESWSKEDLAELDEIIAYLDGVLEPPELTPMALGYAECAIWSSSGHDRNGDEVECLDSIYGIGDLAPKTRAKMNEICAQFVIDNADDILECEFLAEHGKIRVRGAYTVHELIGHDLWLTQHGHGAGFWDGRWPEELGERLTEACKKLPEFETIDVGDDGKLYLE